MRLVFLQKFIVSPQTIGSVTPSSHQLAQAMVRPIDWQSAETIVEWGAGTGIITSYIQRRKKPGAQAFIFELDDDLRRHLANTYPHMTHEKDARQTRAVLAKQGCSQVDCILSGLPFFNFPEALRETLLEEAKLALKPGGLFVAFQYSLQMKRHLEKRFPSLQLDFVPLNIPPAFVYIAKKADS